MSKRGGGPPVKRVVYTSDKGVRQLMPSKVRDFSARMLMKTRDAAEYCIYIEDGKSAINEIEC